MFPAQGPLFRIAHSVLEAARQAWPALAADRDGAGVTVITREGDVLGTQVLRGGSARTQSKLELVVEVARDVWG